MSSPEETFKNQFPYIAAAQEAAELANPANELQQAAAREIMQLAFAAEVKRAFPDDSAVAIED